MKLFALGFAERRQRRREAEASARWARERIEQRERDEFWRQCREAQERHAAELAYRAEYPALRERFILAALAGLTAQPCVLTTESDWLGHMAIDRAEAAMRAAGYYMPPKGQP